MDNKQKQEYEELCDSLADRYCRLLLITGDSQSKKDMLHQLWNNESRPLRIGKELVILLHDQTADQRTKIVVDFFIQLLNRTGILFLTDIEILFDRSLRINPLSILKNAARNQAIIVDWPGKINFSTGKLTYASPEYADYFCEDLTEDVLFFDESGRNSLNNTNHRS